MSWWRLPGAVVGIMLSCGIAARVLAVDYWVDPSGNDAAAGDAGAPLRSIGRAAALAGPGDTVFVQPGLYVESVVLAHGGAAGTPLTFRAEPGAVLESPDATASLSAFDVSAGVGDVVIDGFVARNGFDETIFVREGAHDVVVRNCELSGNQVGVWIAGATDVTVERCAIHDNALGLRVSGASRRIVVRDTTSSFNDDQLGCLGDADGFTVDETVTDVTFAGCRAQGNGEDGFDLQGDAMQLAAVESRDNGCAGLKLSQNVRVENALVVGNTTGITTSSFFGLPVFAQIINSTVADNRGTQLFLRTPNPNVSPVVLLRNVIGSGAGKIVEIEWPVTLFEDHNLFFRPDTTAGAIVRHLADGSDRRYSGQAINTGAWAADSGQGTATLAVDPRFADAVTYRVAADSAAAERGSAVSAPAVDRNGVARPRGTIDIGPDEVADAVDDHRPWADPGPPRTVSVQGQLSVEAYGSVDPDGDALSYVWDFGDGSPTANGYRVSHRYAAAGDFLLTLSASDGRLSDSRSVLIHVADPTATPTPSATPPWTPTPSSTATAASPTDLPLTATPVATATDTPPTDTPVATASPLPTDTPQPTPAMHDSAIRAPRRIKVHLRNGVATFSKTVSVALRNDDMAPEPESPGHVIRLVVDAGDCPGSTLSGLTSADASVAPEAMVAGGHKVRMRFTLVVDRDAFFSPARRTPATCRLRLQAVGPGTDPTPDDNLATVELSIIDDNDF